MFISNIAKLLKLTTIFLAVVTIILPVSLSLQAKTPSPTEAILTVEFNNPATENTIQKLLKKEIANNQVNINSASSQIDIAGSKHTFNLANEKNLDINQFFNFYQKSYQAYLSTLTILKSETEQLKKVENVENIKPLLNKYSKDNLQKTKTKESKIKLKLNSISLSGSLKSLDKLKTNNFYGLVKKTDLINLVEMQQKVDELKIKFDKLTTDTEK